MHTITILILFAAQLYTVYGIPINFANNNQNNYNENHANWPLPNQPPVSPLLSQRPPYPYNQQQFQSSQNHGPEMEDFGRFNTNQKQFRRNAMVPPDVMATPGAFQPNPHEKFGQSGGASGNNFRHSAFDDQPHQQFNNHFRHQSQPEADSGFYSRFQGQDNNQFYKRSPSHDAPPSHPSHFSYPNAHPEEYRHFNNFPNQHPNEIFREKSNSFRAPVDEWPTGSPPYPAKPAVEERWKEQSPTHHHYPFPSPVFGEANNVPGRSAMPAQPTAIAIVVPGVNGNSTYFIEYDVSDNDVTSETIVEVEDLPEHFIISNHVSPVT